MARIFLGLGSNLGDKRANIKRALELLAACSDIHVLKVSSMHDTAPVGFTEQPDFLNAVALIETTLSPRELLNAALDIERGMGRKRTIRWGPRVIDIDILLYDDERIEEEGLIIPHPRMMERGFVLDPLAEIVPDLVLPDGQTAREAAREMRNEDRGTRIEG